MSTQRLHAFIAFTIYACSIAVSNYFITHVGVVVPGSSTHLAPVGFGLMAPSGAYTAAVSFPARDVTQRLGGRLLGIAAIVVGGAISFAFSSPQIAAASAMTFLVSESADFLVYTPLSRRYFAPAVVISSIVAAIVDSILFLYLAGIPEHTTMVLGLIFAKLYIAVVAGAVIYILRKKLPERKI